MNKAAAAPKRARKKEYLVTAKKSKRVRLLAGWGFTQEEIATMLGIGEATLKRHHAEDLRQGLLECDEMVAKRMNQIIKSGNDADAGRWGMFYFKVRRRWHEVQRVIHGYDPETIKAFVKSVVLMLRRELPDKCPGCAMKLDLTPKVAQHLLEISAEMAAKLPQSEVVQMPRPELASDGLDDPA